MIWKSKFIPNLNFSWLWMIIQEIKMCMVGLIWSPWQAHPNNQCDWKGEHQVGGDLPIWWRSGDHPTLAGGKCAWLRPDGPFGANGMPVKVCPNPRQSSPIQTKPDRGLLSVQICHSSTGIGLHKLQHASRRVQGTLPKTKNNTLDDSSR